MNADRHEPDRIDDILRTLAAEAGGAAVVLLTPVAEGAVVAIASAGTPGSVALHRLRMGSPDSGSAVLRHDPPTPSELERAIEIIEDAVMPLARRITAGSVLFVDAAALDVLWEPDAAAGSPTRRVSTDEVEAR